MANLSREVRRLLSNAGWKFLRHGKGDHEIWHDPVTSRKVVVDDSLKSRHTANAILRQAGIPKAF